jgi:hypothetical protein
MFRGVNSKQLAFNKSDNENRKRKKSIVKTGVVDKLLL